MEFLHEIHLALNNVPKSIATKIDGLGFDDNSFDTGFRVEKAAFRRTLHSTKEPSNELWNSVIEIIQEESSITGTAREN